MMKQRLNLDRFVNAKELNRKKLPVYKNQPTGANAKTGKINPTQS